MSKVTTETPDRPDEEKGTTIMRLSDTAKSDAHVAQLLHIAEHCTKHLCWRLDSGETMEMDPTVTTETKKTLELVHSRVRDLIDEQRRWSLDPTATERESSKLIDSTLELYNQKTINAKIYNRPAIFLRPRIQRFREAWFCWVGDREVPQSSELYGSGSSPALAMEAFDKAYYDLPETVEQVSTQVSEPAQKRTRKPKKT